MQCEAPGKVIAVDLIRIKSSLGSAPAHETLNMAFGKKMDWPDQPAKERRAESRIPRSLLHM